jgi:hypothetical protein
VIGLVFHPPHKGINGELFGADPVQRRNNATQNMVPSIELLGAFNRQLRHEYSLRRKAGPAFRDGLLQILQVSVSEIL